MKIAYFANQTALQSEPIWRAFLESCQNLGITPVENRLDADFAVIWSVLWKGRLEKNRNIYYHYRNLGKPVFILEVGSIFRGKTWKVSVNNINNYGIYANDSDFLPDRIKKLGILIESNKNFKDKPILIAGQHDASLQWDKKVTNLEWILKTIKRIRKFSDALIYVRPHPRNKFDKILEKNVYMEDPIKIPETYDQYDLKFKYNVIVNYNSGVGTIAAIHGVPVICDESSLANEVSMPIENINSPFLPDRTKWIEKIAHTEWTLEEIQKGIPLKRLLNRIA